ncbi:MAG: Ig-like domain-containing protein [Eubacterium sp.]
MNQSCWQEETLLHRSAQYQLNYKTTPKKTLEEITWDSSNDDVATISEDGLLTIKKKVKSKSLFTPKKQRLKDL